MIKKLTEKEKIEILMEKRRLERLELSKLLVCKNCNRKMDFLVHTINGKLCHSCVQKTDLKPDSKYKLKPSVHQKKRKKSKK